MQRAPQYTDGWEFGIQPESTYGIINEASCTICRLECDRVTINRNPRFVDVRASRQQLNPQMKERHEDFSGSIATYTIANQPLNAYAESGSVSPFALLCAAHFQKVASNVYSYFTAHPATPGVDHSYTLYASSPAAGEDITITGGINKTLDMTFERGEPVKISCEGEGYDAGGINQTITGTMASSGSTASPPTPLDFTWKLDVDGAGDTDFTMRSVALHFVWDNINAEDPTDGKYLTRSFGKRKSCTFTVTMVVDDTSQAVETKLGKGKKVKLTIAGNTAFAAVAAFTDIWVTGMIDSIEHSTDDEDVDLLTFTCTMKSDGAVSFAEIDLA